MTGDRARPAVFLDRDGTINRERGYVTHPDQLDVLPGVEAALRRLAGAGFRLIVVTNQGGIARGLYTESDLARIHEVLHERIGRLPELYLHCPHHPDFGEPCTCRKPAPGMLHRAAELLPIDLPRSFVVGDTARDILTARDLPIRSILVHSGKPAQAQLRELAEVGVAPDHEAADLAAAADWILTVHGSTAPESA